MNVVPLVVLRAPTATVTRVWQRDSYPAGAAGRYDIQTAARVPTGTVGARDARSEVPSSLRAAGSDEGDVASNDAGGSVVFAVPAT